VPSRSLAVKTPKSALKTWVSPLFFKKPHFAGPCCIIFYTFFVFWCMEKVTAP
jgi:hypothetical protein